MYIKTVHRDNLSVEANVRRMPNGDLIIVCTCGDVCEPAPQNRVYLFRSTDDGLSWSDKVLLGEEDGQAHYHTETTVVGDQILVFVTKHDGKFLNWRNFVYKSSDSGKTWEEKPFSSLYKYAFVRSMTKLSNGMLLFPYHSFPVTDEQEKECVKNGGYVWNNAVDYYESGFLISDANANDFERHKAFDITNEDINKFNIKWVWTENTVIEAENGHLIMLFRIDKSGCLWRSDSFDFGKTWEKPYATDIPNPANKPQLLKADKNRIVLINTPNSVYGLDNRYPLSVWISDDGLKSFVKKINLSDFPGGYSYANGFIENNILYLAFEFNRHDIYFAKIDLEKD